jgi:hypothetical protein
MVVKLANFDPILDISAISTTTGGEEDMVLELEARKAERGALVHPTREPAEVGIGKASLVMIMRGRLEGTMSATVAQAVGLR